MQILTQLLPFHVGWRGSESRIDFHCYSASPWIPICSLTGFMKDTKSSHHLLYALLCYIAPRAFPRLSLFTACLPLPGEGKVILWLHRWLPQLGTNYKVPWYHRELLEIYLPVVLDVSLFYEHFAICCPDVTAVFE